MSMADLQTALCLQTLVHKYLSANLLDCARFYAERLYYELPNDNTVYLLALCYFRAGKVHQTYLILLGAKSSMCKYLFALSCEKLDKLSEGEEILRPNIPVENLSLETVSDIPGGAEGLYLLGRICKRQHRREIATIYYKLSLQVDPYLWCSLAELSEMGVAVNIKEQLSSGVKSGTNVFNENQTHRREGVVLGSIGTVPQEEKADFLGDIQAAEYYSSANLFGDQPNLAKHKAAEMLGQASVSANNVTSAGVGLQLSPKVSAALGMSTMSLHMPFPSPGSLPSPLLAHQSSTDYSHTGDSFRGHGYRFADHQASGEGVRTGFRRDGLQDTRTALFGLGTPGLTPVSGSHYPVRSASMMSEDAIRAAALPDSSGSEPASSIRGVDLFGSSAPSSTATGIAHPRRVSFGPTARLSFSGALEGGGLHGRGSLLDQDVSEDLGEESADVSAFAAEDNYPFKLPRADPQVGSPSANAHRNSETSSRALPHKLMLSPFPVESSPISQNEDAENSEQPFPLSPNSRRRYGVRSSGVHSAVPHLATMYEDKENGSERSGGEEPFSEGIANVQSSGRGSSATVHGAQDGNSTSAPMQVSTAGLDNLLVTFARAYQMLCLYCCRAAIDELQRCLPERHFRSGLASQWVGKAYYEMNEYKSAMMAFREMLRVEPYRLCGLETLSTALWHLKRDKELSSLAQRAVEIDKLSPQTWCVVGNCFSLQKEPDTAIRFFQRALQLDPSFTYAYTLSGHEQVNNEDLDKAIESFRMAILHNERHYNAWYGLGSIYYRQEKYELAEYHFRRALSVNPASSVLHCYLGMALHAQGSATKTTEALDVLSSAAERDPNNPQLHFQRATILVAVDNLPDALAALLVVEERAPKEAPVHALLGQVYHRMGELQLAIKHLNIAMDLDPKESTVLKGILEHIDDPPFQQE